MRSFRSIPLLPLLALLATASTPLSPDRIRAVPVRLDRADPGRTAVGALRYLGGWELESRNAHFGGLSTMAWKDGRLVAVSDAGTIFDIGFVNGVPVGRVIGPLPDGPGPGIKKSDRDAESMTVDPVTGRHWVGFEFHNQIWRYDRSFSKAEAHSAPPAMAKWPRNGGPEAMIRLPDGRFLVFAETAPRPEGATALLIFPGDPTDPANVPEEASYRPPEGFNITDVTALPDGRLILLHRRFRLSEGMSAIVSIMDLSSIQPGQMAEGRPIARLVPPLTVDNMEALAVSREKGRTILWIASDDNFNPLQRTLLLKFAIE